MPLKIPLNPPFAKGEIGGLERVDMNNHQLDFLARIGRHLWRLVIIDNSFKAGSYLLAVSVVLLLAARVFGISFLAESYLLFLSPLIGLLAGAVVGLFNKPAMADVALVADSKLGLNNYLSTAYDCSSRPSPNPVEDALVSDMARQGGNLTAGFVFMYNWRYFYLFLILSGVMLIIWATPVPTGLPSVVAPIISADNIITISQGLSDMKDKTQENYLVQEFIQEIEALLANIKNNPQDKTVLMERVNKFLQDLPGLEIPAQESAYLQTLLEKLASFGSELSAGYDSGKNTATADDTFSRYQVGHNVSNTGMLNQGQTDKSGQIQPYVVSKTKEEAINNPYLPGEYKEIVKKYFSED